MRSYKSKNMFWHNAFFNIQILHKMLSLLLLLLLLMLWLFFLEENEMFNENLFVCDTTMQHFSYSIIFEDI